MIMSNNNQNSLFDADHNRSESDSVGLGLQRPGRILRTNILYVVCKWLNQSWSEMERFH